MDLARDFIETDGKDEDAFWPERRSFLPEELDSLDVLFRAPAMQTHDAGALRRTWGHDEDVDVPGSMPLWTLSGLSLRREGWSQLGGGWVVGSFRLRRQGVETRLA